MTQRWLGAPIAAAQELLECVSEIARAEAVNKRIRSRVAVSKPEEEVEENHWRALTTESLGKVDGKKRRPADHEATDDNTNCFGSFLLLVEAA